MGLEHPCVWPGSWWRQCKTLGDLVRKKQKANDSAVNTGQIMSSKDGPAGPDCRQTPIEIMMKPLQKWPKCPR